MWPFKRKPVPITTHMYMDMLWRERERVYKEQLAKEQEREQEEDDGKREVGYGPLSYNNAKRYYDLVMSSNGTVVSKSGTANQLTYNPNYSLSMPVEMVETEEQRNERERLELRETLRKAQGESTVPRDGTE